MTPTLDQLAGELVPLVFDAFAEAEALKLGQILVGFALAGRMPVVIDIRTANRRLFHAALPGSAPLNDLWAQRKANTALRFQQASLLVGLRLRETGETLERHGLSLADHADHGGAVPIRVRGVGVVAVATVSGLPQVEDHALVVRGLAALLGG